ncbi:MAG: hypothetical protein ACFCVG_11325 [Kineosporiaceae bacterium]
MCAPVSSATTPEASSTRPANASSRPAYDHHHDRRPSPAVTRVLADTLRLGPADRRHLDRLIARGEAGTGGHGRADCRSAELSRPRWDVRPAVDLLLQALHPVPALALSASLDVVAWNDAMRAVLVDFGDAPVEQRNLVRLNVLHEPFRALWADRDETSREAVAFLRSALADRPRDPRLLSLLGELSSASTDFAGWWAAHEVKERCRGHKNLRHPVGGELRVSYEMLRLDSDDQRIVVYLPADATSAVALSRITGAGPPRALRWPARSSTGCGTSQDDHTEDYPP